MGSDDLQNLLDRANRYLVGGCTGMFRMPDDVVTVFHHGEGSRLFDVTGREYIDYVMGSGPLILGHAHPAVIDAVRHQLSLGTTFFGLHAPVIRLAERLVEVVPCAERVRFTSSGSDGTFSALRLARAFTGREKILKFEGGWHGGHDYAQQSAYPPMPGDGPVSIPDCDGIPKTVSETVLVAPFNDPGIAAEVINNCAQDLAAVIVEPLQRAIRPVPGFLQALREATEAHNVVLIFDEIVTGFRIAWGGAQERYGVVPDMAVYGKSISGGFPMAAICGRADIMDCADPRRRGNDSYAFISSTANGNPIGTTAGLVCLDELGKEGVYPRLYAVPGQLKDGLESLGRERGLPLRVFGEGPVMQPFFTDIEILNYTDTLKADAKAAWQFGREMIKRGIYVTPGGKLYLSLAHSESDVDRTLEAAKGALEEVRVEGVS